eukprot:TRINITY_DN4911_c0_g1_i5.p3 TRINITY_DN4911_c0_g1~~TRINITY_DN4911_c0_g1_i5.p3  ORF type:complete len:129 (+),score=19.38 TRINITY_DN4911_c0_g1_i5:25-411(+)
MIAALHGLTKVYRRCQQLRFQTKIQDCLKGKKCKMGCASGGKHIHRKPINLSEEAQNQQQERNERSLDDVQLVQNTSVEQNEPNLEIDLETVQPDQVENSKTGRKWRRIAVIGAVLAVGLGVLGKIVR